jgi:hypothetical protein
MAISGSFLLARSQLATISDAVRSHSILEACRWRSVQSPHPAKHPMGGDRPSLGARSAHVHLRALRIA